jgi:hypothetical protein
MYILPHLFHINSCTKYADCRACRDDPPMAGKVFRKVKRFLWEDVMFFWDVIFVLDTHVNVPYIDSKWRFIFFSAA